MVEEAKAFCPGCGNAIVEEKKRASVSEFDKLDHTVQLGQTMYNQMLSDMGLSPLKKPGREDKRIEPEKPIAKDPEPMSRGGLSVAMIVFIGILVLGIAVLVAAAIVIVFLYSR